MPLEAPQPRDLLTVRGFAASLRQTPIGKPVSIVYEEPTPLASLGDNINWHRCGEEQAPGEHLQILSEMFPLDDKL